jgi:hypothetical protein
MPLLTADEIRAFLEKLGELYPHPGKSTCSVRLQLGYSAIRE